MKGAPPDPQSARRMELAAQELFNFGRLREPEEAMSHMQAVKGAQVQAVFEQLLQPGRSSPAVALAGSVPQRARACAEALFS
ncbi:hypothetical protein [Roseateles oligotrophus]|uniref:Uncharacterized protein n=1 Tax=Roseateles oligotrophus TaxID=1769250 RepID=A0ABT2Y9E7_9BURK|nr:hypothetical protein [Roseateles oligotrophus]MCV2366908.1 hypothetical protein [Roseateles oligotrophus]